MVNFRISMFARFFSRTLSYKFQFQRRRNSFDFLLFFRRTFTAGRRFIDGGIMVAARADARSIRNPGPRRRLLLVVARPRPKPSGGPERPRVRQSAAGGPVAAQIRARLVAEFRPPRAGGAEAESAALVAGGMRPGVS